MKRRGIGNVIAAAIMVFLLIFTVSQLYIYNLGQLDDYNRVAAQMLNISGQKGNERISITNAQLDVSGSTAKVTLGITNTGAATVHIVDVWMGDVTDSTRQHQHCYKGGCSGWTTELYIGSGLSLTMPQLDTNMPITDLITVKVFTELGVSTSVQLVPPGLAGVQSNLLATTQMILVPPNPITSNDIIAVLTVTNNNNLGVAFTSLTPDICLAHGYTPPIGSVSMTGSATGSPTSTTISDSSKSWTTNQWQNYIVGITSGTGAGQVRTIISNTATELTINSAWTTIPISGSGYSIYTVNKSCHASNQVTGGTADSPFSPTTLRDAGMSWGVNQWVNYLVVITAGTGVGQSRLIASNTVDTLTVNAAWTTTPTATSVYAIRTNFCNVNSGVTTDSAAKCTRVQGPTPSSLSYLPAGGSVTFQWIYQVDAIVSDTPVAIVASYVNITSTSGLFASQTPVQTALVRGAGGASSSSGGSFTSALGNFQITYQSFRILQRSSTTDVGPWTSSQWSNNLDVSRNSYLVLSINITNTGSVPATLSTKSMIAGQRLSVSGTSLFYIVFFNSATGQISTYGGANTLTFQPGQRETVYFAVASAGGNPTNAGQAVRFQQADTFLLVIALDATLQSTPTQQYGQAIPFVAVEST